MKNNWELKTLGDLCEVVTKGTTPTSIGHKFVNDGINFVKIESIDLNRRFLPNKFASITEDCHSVLKRSQLKENDILFSIAGALGRTALVTKDILPANTNQALAIIRLKKSDDVLTEFILMTLESGLIFEQINKFKGGVAQQNLSLEQVKSFQILLPPLPEQQRIVAILDEAFAAIGRAKENAEKNLQNARELFDSYLQSVFANPGDGWELRNIGSVCKTGAGGTPLKAHKEYYEGGNVPWLLSGEVSQGEIFESKNFITEKGLKNSSARLFPIDTVLVAMYGATAGQVGILKFEASTNQAVCGILPNENFLPEFVYYYFLSKKEELVSQAVGGAQPNISQIKIKNTLIPILAVSEQRNIVNKIKSLSTETKKLENIYRQKINDLDELKKSILQKAFNGEL